jgi:hypothetical protein
MRSPRRRSAALLVLLLAAAACGSKDSPAAPTTAPPAGSPAPDIATFDYQGALPGLADVQPLLSGAKIKEGEPAQAGGLALSPMCGQGAPGFYAASGGSLEFQDKGSAFFIDVSITGFAGDEARKSLERETQLVAGCTAPFTERGARWTPTKSSKTDGTLSFEYDQPNDRARIIEYWTQDGPFVLEMRIGIDPSLSTVPNAAWGALSAHVIQGFRAAVSAA